MSIGREMEKAVLNRARTNENVFGKKIQGTDAAACFIIAQREWNFIWFFKIYFLRLEAFTVGGWKSLF
jgi:hypothetical protein